MKTLFVKFFMVIAAGLCMFEGVILAAIGLGRLTPEKLTVIYSRLIEAPKALPTILGIGMFFVLLGFILLILSSRTRPLPKMITVNKEGKILRIPQQTIKSFIKQIIEQNPYARDISIELETKEQSTDIRIEAAFNGVPSVYEELNRIEEVLKSEIQSVFDWKDFQFTFQMRGVSVDQNKKFFSTGKKKTGQITGSDTQIEEPQLSSGEEELENQEIPEINHMNKLKDKTKDKTLITKMLWGGK